jgi:hypothetical protein
MFCPVSGYSQYSGTFYGAKIYFCHTTATSLSTTFDDNYAGNTPVLVVSRSALPLNWAENAWNQIGFGGWFAYNGTDNLLIEIRWESASGALITSTTYPTNGVTLLGSSVDATTGYAMSDRPVFKLWYSSVTQPPVISSDTVATGAVNIAFTYQLVATGLPTNYSATALPAGLTLNPSSGLISGTPTAVTTSQVQVSAMNAYGTGHATISFTINPEPIPGLLSVSGVPGGTSTINLTAEGTDDWAHWGFSSTSIDHKSVAGSPVNHITEWHSATPLQYSNNTNGYSWSDGTPTVNAVATTTGIYVVGGGNDFFITVPADTTTRTLKLYVGGWMSYGGFDAYLSDSSAAEYTDYSFFNTNASYNAVYTITYKAGAANQNLTVVWWVAGGPSGGNVTLQAATLQVSGGSVPPPVMSVARQSGQAGRIELSWQSASNAAYAVYKTTNLLTGWPALPLTNNTSGDGAAKFFSEPVGPLPAAYYRLKAAGN